MRFYLSIFAIVSLLGYGLYKVFGPSEKKTLPLPGSTAPAVPPSTSTPTPAPSPSPAPPAPTDERKSNPFPSPDPSTLPPSVHVYRFQNRPLPSLDVLNALARSNGSSGPSVQPSFSVDPPSNSLLYSGTDAFWIQSLHPALQAMDCVLHECYVDCLILFVSSDRVRDFEAGLTYSETASPLGSLTMDSSGFGVVLPAGAFALRLNFLHSTGAVEIQDRPQLRLANGQQSTVTTGEDIPIPVAVVSQGVSQSGIRFERVGLNFQVTPTFLDPDHIRLDVTAENGIVGPPRTVNGIEVPAISRQSVKSVATLGLDDSVILGGLHTVRREIKDGLFSTSELSREGKLFVALVLRSGSPRACPVDLSSPPDDVHPLLPARGWLDSEIDRVEKVIRSRFGRP